MPILWCDAITLSYDGSMIWWAVHISWFTVHILCCDALTLSCDGLMIWWAVNFLWFTVHILWCGVIISLCDLHSLCCDVLMLLCTVHILIWYLHISWCAVHVLYCDLHKHMEVIITFDVQRLSFYLLFFLYAQALLCGQTLWCERGARRNCRYAASTV